MILIQKLVSMGPIKGELVVGQLTSSDQIYSFKSLMSNPRRALVSTMAQTNGTVPSSGTFLDGISGRTVTVRTTIMGGSEVKKFCAFIIGD